MKNEIDMVASQIVVPATKETETGVAYNVPKGMDEDRFIAIVKEFVDLTKVKGLTTRQAQILFQVCNEYILDQKLI